jgi:putative phosphoesterase
MTAVRLAIVSDVHGNLAALEAVVGDLRRSAPDLVVLGGDVALLGPHPVEVVDRVRALGWPSVIGNCDELPWEPAVRAEQERRAPKLRGWLDVLFGRFGPWAAEPLGEERMAWLRAQPRDWRDDDVWIVHASPDDLWRAPAPDAGDAEMAGVYAEGGVALAVYGHVHRPFVRSLPALTVANAGSVGMPWDGDWRPAYLLVDDGVPAVVRVEYDMERAVRDLAGTDFPLADWLASTWRSGRFSRPA